MKKIGIVKKLALNKERIATLNATGLYEIKGGATGDRCSGLTKCGGNCPTRKLKCKDTKPIDDKEG